MSNKDTVNYESGVKMLEESLEILSQGVKDMARVAEFLMGICPSDNPKHKKMIELLINTKVRVQTAEWMIGFLGNEIEEENQIKEDKEKENCFSDPSEMDKSRINRINNEAKIKITEEDINSLDEEPWDEDIAF